MKPLIFHCHIPITCVHLSVHLLPVTVASAATRERPWYLISPTTLACSSARPYQGRDPASPSGQTHTPAVKRGVRSRQPHGMVTRTSSGPLPPPRRDALPFIGFNYNEKKENTKRTHLASGKRLQTDTRAEPQKLKQNKTSWILFILCSCNFSMSKQILVCVYNW